VWKWIVGSCTTQGDLGQGGNLLLANLGATAFTASPTNFLLNVDFKSHVVVWIMTRTEQKRQDTLNNCEQATKGEFYLVFADFGAAAVFAVRATAIVAANLRACARTMCGVVSL